MPKGGRNNLRGGKKSRKKHNGHTGGGEIITVRENRSASTPDLAAQKVQIEAKEGVSRAGNNLPRAGDYVKG